MNTRLSRPRVAGIITEINGCVFHSIIVAQVVRILYRIDFFGMTLGVVMRLAIIDYMHLCVASGNKEGCDSNY
ncbi:hypothetical protein QA596_11150 [Balneolales bacterium ANBcel1]|nr:hypothetical protein [Balneolales bacterium ANBcel1]